MLKSPAKINLTLDILGKHEGYHLIDGVICEVGNLYDEIKIELLSKTGGEIEIKTSNKELNRNPKNNLAYKAAKLIAPKASMKIFIKKNIPLRSGLGGGSSNAATVLKTLSRLLELKYSDAKLEKLATSLGMDVPFFIRGGVAHVSRFGEIIKPIKTKIRFAPRFVFLKTKKSTKDMYSRLDLSMTGKNRAKTKKLIMALKNNNLREIKKNIHNDFELIAKPPRGTRLTGSGSACFKLGPVHTVRL